MPSSEFRQVVASDKPGEIVKIVNGGIRPPYSNEAVVNVTAISLNRGELRRAQNAADGRLQIGWDFVGTVDQVAADGTGPVSGTRVVGFSTRMEGWAEQVAVPTAYIAPIPDGVSDADAATLPVAGLTALHAVDAGVGLIGREVLITGATGGVGAFAVQLAAVAGATPLAQIRRDAQRTFIEKLGDYAVCVSESGTELPERGPFRLIVDGVSGPILEHALGALAPDGLCVCYGVTERPAINFDVSHFMRTGLAQMLGFHLYAKSEIAPPSEHLPRLLTLVEIGSLNCAVEREAPWTEIDRVAHDLIERKFLGKAVVHLD